MGAAAQEYGRFARRRFTVSLSVVVVVLFGLLASTKGTNIRAQQATPDTTAMMADMATHPAVGLFLGIALGG